MRALAGSLARRATSALVGYFLLPERIEESGINQLILDEALFASAKATPRWWPSGSVAGSFGLLNQVDDFLISSWKIRRKQLAKNPKNSKRQVLIDTPLASCLDPRGGDSERQILGGGAH
jgi:hypothetical protein